VQDDEKLGFTVDMNTRSPESDMFINDFRLNLGNTSQRCMCNSLQAAGVSARTFHSSLQLTEATIAAFW
jgi:hypothetical protein